MNNGNNKFNQNYNNKINIKNNENDSYNNMDTNKKEVKNNNEVESQSFGSNISENNSRPNATDENYNNKIKNENLMENKKLKMENEKLKKDLGLLRDLNKNLIRYKGSISISPEGKYIYNPNINESNKNKLEEIERREKELNQREKELNEREKELNKKEKEFNNKVNFLEDKENQIENNKKKFDELNLKNQIPVLTHLKGNQKVIKPLDLYKSPTLIGLNNIGAHYIMNPTLQCLSQTKRLTNYFLNEKNKEKIINNKMALKNKKDNQLSPIYLELLQKLWEIDGHKSFSPKTFANKVNNINPLFKKGKIGDAKDFIIFILEQLHKELKKSNNIIISNDNQILNQYDKNLAFNYFINNFEKEHSIISDLFFGFNETTTECLNCKKTYNTQNLNNPICYNYNIFNHLEFPLEEIKNSKNNEMQHNNINNNILSLDECFLYSQKKESLTGDNRNYCNICQQLYDSIYTSKIFISPYILIIILDRGKGNINDVKLNFSEIIDITQFIIKKDSPKLIYNLYGVISHIMQSGPNLHFVASCKSPIDNKWYKYDDAFVNPITNLQKEVIEFGIPYVLFYKKNNI